MPLTLAILSEVRLRKVLPESTRAWHRMALREIERS